MLYKSLSCFILFVLLQACVPIAKSSGAVSSKDITPVATSDEANAHFKAGAYDEAIALYKLLSAAQSEDMDVLFKLAESYRLKGETKDAIPLYQEIIAKNNTIFHAKEGLGLALLQARQLDAAIEIFLELLREDATRWRTINALGVIYSLQGNTQEADNYYEMARVLQRDNATILNNMGLAYTLVGKKKSYGIELLKEALSLAKTEVIKRQITLNLALAHGIAGNDDIVRTLLKPLLSEAAIYNNLGIYASLRDDRNLAKTYLSKALTSEPVFYEKAWKNLERIK